MAKLFNGMIPFASAIKPTGAQPLDDRTVVKSFADLLADDTFGLAKYNGMLVAVVDDEQVYMLIDKDNSSNEESWVAVGAGNGSVAVETYAEAVAIATDENIGQVIYVKTKSSYDADGEGEGEAIEYEAAPYIVIGNGVLQKLAASTASGDIEGDVVTLQSDVAGLKTDVTEVEGRVEAAEQKVETLMGTADVEGSVDSKIAAIVFPVTDVKVDGASVVEDGVANIVIPEVDLEPYAKTEDVNAELLKKVDVVEGKSLVDNAEITKLAGIEANAEKNIIEVVKVNGSSLVVAESDRSVDITIPTAPVQGVAAEEKVISLDGDKLKTTLTLSYVPATEKSHAALRLQGIDGAVIYSLDATAFVKDGMISGAKLEGPKGDETGEKYLVLTFNTDAGAEDIRMDVSELLDYYAAGDGLALDGKTFAIQLDATAESYLKVTTNGLAVSEALWNKVDEKDNAVLAAAKEHAETFANGLNNAMDTRVATLEAINHDAYVEADAALKKDLQEVIDTKANADDVYTKEIANTTFVTVEGYVEYTQAEKEKLAGVAEGAQVNVVESIKVNGIEATIDNKAADVTIAGTNVALGKAIEGDVKDPETGDVTRQTVYESTAALSDVLQGIQDSIAVAVSGGLTGVVAGDGMAVSAVAGNKQTISVKVSAAEGNLITADANGIYAAMYYEGDDVE